MISAIVGSVIGFIAYKVIRTHQRQPTTGREELIGKIAIVRTPLHPEGTVLYRGELWTATLDQGQAEPNEEVTITRTEGLKLYVTRKT
ncbi:MAG: NfeD family protein [Dehalococcoidales bacterium]|nr:NfeD family protein [Dehalococcoidales bacterium]